MQFIDPFVTFNPISGYFSSPYSELGKSKIGNIGERSDIYGSTPIILDWMVGRAQKIVKGRSLEEINGALEVINFLISAAINENTPLINPRDDSEFNLPPMRDPRGTPADLFTPARLLRSQLKNIENGADELFPKGTWPEYFAVLALAALGELHRLTADNINLATVALAAEAMEALTIAESPELVGPILTGDHRKKVSSQNQSNAIRRHAAVNRWKGWFRKWVLEEHVPSLGDRPLNKQEAARLYKEDVIDPRIKNGLAPELNGVKDIIRVLVSSLGNDPRFADG